MVGSGRSSSLSDVSMGEGKSRVDLVALVALCLQHALDVFAWVPLGRFEFHPSAFSGRSFV